MFFQEKETYSCRVTWHRSTRPILLSSITQEPPCPLTHRLTNPKLLVSLCLVNEKKMNRAQTLLTELPGRNNMYVPPCSAACRLTEECDVSAVVVYRRLLLWDLQPCFDNPSCGAWRSVICFHFLPLPGFVASFKTSFPSPRVKKYEKFILPLIISYRKLGSLFSSESLLFLKAFC